MFCKEDENHSFMNKTIIYNVLTLSKLKCVHATKVNYTKPFFLMHYYKKMETVSEI